MSGESEYTEYAFRHPKYLISVGWERGLSVPFRASPKDKTETLPSQQPGTNDEP